MRVFCLSANRRNENSPIVGIKFRQSSERKSANRRKGLAKNDEMVYAYAYRRRDGVYVVPIGCLKN